MYGFEHRSIEFVNYVGSITKADKAYNTTNMRDDGFVCCTCINFKNQKQSHNTEHIQCPLLLRDFIEENYKSWTMHVEDMRLA